MPKATASNRKKTAAKNKTSFVMVTFGVRNAALGRKFYSLVEKTDHSEAGLARELIAEGMKTFQLSK